MLKGTTFFSAQCYSTTTLNIMQGQPAPGLHIVHTSMAVTQCVLGLDRTSQQAVPVHLYVPNLIGYLRLSLLIAAWLLATYHLEPLSLCLFLVNMVLDGVDGALARKYNQVSSFGAWLDVWTDNLTRGLLWCLACPGGLGLLPVMLEMTTFMAIHKSDGAAAWKEGCFRDAPPWVRWLMSNGFKTSQGSFIVSGLFGAPLWLWARRWLPPASPLTAYWLGGVLMAGRCTAASVELWIITRHLTGLLECDEAARRQAVRDAARAPAAASE